VIDRREQPRVPGFLTFARTLAFCLALVAAYWPDPRATAKEPKPDVWQSEIDALTSGDAAHPPPRDGVLFVGSSSIRLWTTLAQDFPGVPVINRGFGGSMIADSTRYASRIIVPYRPKLIVLYAGDNDIDGGHTPQQVIDDFKAFVDQVHRNLPAAVVAFVSIKPSVARAALWPRMRAANEGVARWAARQDSVRYVDIATKMLDANGRPRPELLREDGLHLSPAGYAIWVAELKPLLASYGFKLP
jgi:lysophospholipase L1-like esterase